MFISSNGLNLIKKFEGCKLTAYLDIGGTPTIGYGHTSGVSIGQHITQAVADDFLNKDIAYYCNDVGALIDNKTINFNVNQNMFDALVSFVYNLGHSNLLQLVTGRDKEQIASHMILYVNANHRFVQGLYNRRIAERDLFLKVPEGPLYAYTVKKGDNLTVIAKRLNTTITHLIQVNSIKNPNFITVGQVLKY